MGKCKKSRFREKEKVVKIIAYIDGEFDENKGI